MALLALAAILIASALTAPAGASALDRIQRAKAITFCADVSYPPFDFFDPKTNEAVGFDIDLGRQIARRLGVQASFKNIAFEGLIPSLQAGQCDAILSGLFDTEGRRRPLDFVDYAFGGNALTVKRGAAFRPASLEDLSGHVVAVESGSELEAQLNVANGALLKQGRPPMKIVPLPKASVAFQQVILGLVDAYYGSTVQEVYFDSQEPGRVQLAGPQNSESYVGIATLKRDAALHEALQRSFDQVRASGDYDRLVAKWNFSSMAYRPRPTTGVGKPSAAPPMFDFEFFLRFLVHPPAPVVEGLFLTVQVAVIAQVAGIVLGLGLALARLSPFFVLRRLAAAYSWIWRGTPVLVQLLIIYTGVAAAGIYRYPDLALGPIVVSGALQAALITFSLNEAAYMGEIFRAAIQSIDKGQFDAARAIGMRPMATMRWIILPQAARFVIPPLSNEFTLMIKSTSLLSVIGIRELFGAVQNINSSTFKTFELFSIAAIWYLVLVSLLTLGQQYLEGHLSRPDRDPAKGMASSVEGASL